MNKLEHDEISDFFDDKLKELENTKGEIENIVNTINLIIENSDIIKPDSDEQLINISTDIEIKNSKIKSLLSEMVVDTKKLKSLLNEIKLLKRKRELKLNRDDDSQYDGPYFDFFDL